MRCKSPYCGVRIVVVAGTRPEFIKLAPVVQELRRRGESPTIIATGQHTDLLRGTPFEDGMAPDVNLGLPSSNDPPIYAGLVGGTLRLQWERQRPDLVIVQGDTASAYAGAWAGADLEIPVAHVEAGIRSGDVTDPWPEEHFRFGIDGKSSWQFCATEANRRNVDGEEWRAQGQPTMRTEAYPGSLRERFRAVTGNTGIDALYSHTQPVEQSQKVDRVLITLHRRESFGEPLTQIVEGLWKSAQQYPKMEFIWPIHPNPEIRKVLNGFGGLPQPGNLAYWHPMGTVTFAQQLATSRAVITDSGGVQEEACALGIPCVVAREKTDRPESVELGLAHVAGRTEAGILSALAWALEAKIEPSTVFGDGKAAPRIVEHLLG